jgi:hypothetical protein
MVHYFGSLIPFVAHLTVCVVPALPVVLVLSKGEASIVRMVAVHWSQALPSRIQRNLRRLITFVTIAISLSDFALLFFIFAFNNVETQRHRDTIRVHSTTEAALFDLVVFSIFRLKALVVTPRL